MKRTALILSALVVCAASSAEPGDRLFVAVPAAPLFSAKSALSEVRGRPSYGDEVVVIREDRAWRYVRRIAGGSGWIPMSALSASPVGRAKAVDDGELRFAGRNFAEEEEGAYRTGGGVNYDAVDAMERSSVSDAELRSFLSEGGLKTE